MSVRILLRPLQSFCDMHISLTVCQMLCACLAGPDLTYTEAKASADSAPLENQLARKAGSSDQLIAPDQALNGDDPPLSGVAAAASTTASAAATQLDPKPSSQLGQTHGRIHGQAQPATHTHVVGEELDARASTTQHQVGASAPVASQPAATDRQVSDSQPAGERVVGEEQDGRSSGAAAAVAGHLLSAAVSPSSLRNSAGKEMHRSGTGLGRSTGNIGSNALPQGSELSAGQKGYARQPNNQAGQSPALMQATSCCAWLAVQYVKIYVVCQVTCLALVSLSKRCIRAWSNMRLRVYMIASTLMFIRRQCYQADTRAS